MSSNVQRLPATDGSLPTKTIDESISFGPVGFWILDPLPIQIEVSHTPLTSDAGLPLRVLFRASVFSTEITRVIRAPCVGLIL